MPIVVFSHGKESGPQGAKIQMLSKIATDLGCAVRSLDYRNCTSPEARVELLINQLNQLDNETIILVGSSMGGYVSTVAASKILVHGLFLMCPALYLPAYEIQTYNPKTKHITIIHGWNDQIVPSAHSIRFAKSQTATLHLIEDNHRLSQQRPFLAKMFQNFLFGLLKKDNG